MTANESYDAYLRALGDFTRKGRKGTTPGNARFTGGAAADTQKGFR